MMSRKEFIEEYTTFLGICSRLADERGLNTYDVAALSGLNQSTIWRAFSKAPIRPQLETAVRIGTVFGLKLTASEDGILISLLDKRRKPRIAA